MKKRLLSAFLAFAMVLTLLPATMVPAFAVEYQDPEQKDPSTVVKSVDANGKETHYYEKTTNANGTVTISTVTVTRFATGNDGTKRVYGKWYWLDNSVSQSPKYYEVTSGIVAGNNGSGLWYPDLDAFMTSTTNATTGVTTKALRSTSFTMLGTTDVNMSGFATNNYWTSTTLNVDIDGSGTLTVPENLVSLTVTSKFQSAPTGTVAGLSAINRVNFAAAPNPTSGVTLNATNVNINSISLTGRTNSVTLNGVTMTGGITMKGEYYSSAANQTAKVYTYAGQTLKTGSNTTIGGAIEVDGDGNTVQIADTTANGQTLSVTGSGTVSISGTTKLGNVTAAARGLTGAFPTVNVSGGTVGDITQSFIAGNKNSITITVSNTNTQTGGITVERGTVNLTNGNVQGNVTVKAGTLNATQDNVHVSGNLILGNTDTTNLNLSATNSTYGGITVSNGANLKITGWNSNRVVEGNGSNYGTVDLDGYTGQGITGGSFDDSQTFETVAKMKWLGPDVQFYVKNDKTSTVDLYDANELARAISDITTDKAKTSGNIIVVGQEADNDIVLKNGQNVWARIGYNATTGLIMPESINGMKIAQWYAPDNHNIILRSGTVQGVPLPSKGTELELNASGVTAEAKKLTNVTVASSTTVENRDVRVALNGNVITLSGAIEAGAGGIATIKVNLATDAIDEDGVPIVLKDVAIDYYPNTKQIKFNLIQPSTNDVGGVIQDDGAALVLNNGTGERYTLSANLAVSASTLGIYMGVGDVSPIVVTTGGKLASWTTLEKQALIDKIQDGGGFTIGDNRAVLEAINAAQATITSDTTVATWITNAKNTIWRSGYKSDNTTKNTAPNGFAVSNGKNLTPNTGTFDNTTPEGAEIASLFAKAYIVPYLVVNITDYDRNGTLTATLTPYYRVDVSAAADYDPDFYYTVQAGRAMSALTGTMCPDGVKIDLGLDGAFDELKMHQDGKYVYTGSSGEWTITHAGINGNGLGTIVINNIEGPISMETDIDGRSPTIAELGCTYDTLQAAIDDTLRGTVIQTSDEVVGILTGETMDTITVGGDYAGSCAITMTGVARKVKVVAEGQQNVTATGANTTVERLSTQVAGGYVYVVELKQDTAEAGKNIVVASAAGGSASVNANPATVGQTVTVTLSPSSGYTSSGVTVRTNTGSAVSVSGSGNTYTFVMPSASTVTVTPSFTASQQQVGANVYVSNANTGSGSAVTTAGSNKVNAGTTVTVTTTPGVGQRTMGLNVTGATATRTGVNQFQFTVPSGYTTVTVTPSFDVDNSTVFSDVWSSEYYSAPVAWAVGKGITNGTSTYTFGPTNVCTREDMVTFLYRAAGSPAVGNVTNPFYDVVPGSYYYNAVMWAVSKGITNGVSANQFGVGQYVTRAQAVTFLYRYENSPAASTSNGFYDVPSSEYYAKAVTWAQNKGVTNGTTTTTFGPNEYCQRGQIVTFLYRDINNIRA